VWLTRRFVAAGGIREYGLRPELLR
jgi:hypothetical protein